MPQHALAARVKYDDELPRKTTASWEEVEKPLYLMAVVFNVIVLPKMTVCGGKREDE